MIKLVIIDFDDTLSLTEATFFEIENFIARKLGYPPMSRKTHQRNWGKPIEEAILERVPGVDPEAFMKIHREIFPKLVQKGEIDTISDENINTLKKLKNDGKCLAILTNRNFHEVKHLLDKNHHLNKFIEKLYHRDNSKYFKPDSRAFDQIIKNFNVKRHEAVYIGDSIGDAISAKGAGIHFVALLESKLRTKEDFKSVDVDFFAQKFPDILSYIEKK